MRYKEYNTNVVLEKAINLFWDKGFNGCSINDLVDLTGVNRFSLYHEFDNKEGILYNSLTLYRNRYCDEHLNLLKNEGELIATLNTFYLSFLKENNRIFGCYFIHIGTELADSNNEVKTALENYLNEIKQGFIALLSKHGYDSEKTDVLSDHLLGLYCTAMSFCLIHTPSEREKYINNGITIILN
jgi:AcrR family transcriptional regulator